VWPRSQLLEKLEQVSRSEKSRAIFLAFLLLAGGVPVKENNTTIGAIGIGGAPRR